MNPPRTEAEYISSCYHEFMGMICDGAFKSRSGAELSIWVRAMQAKLLTLLQRTYAENLRGAEVALRKEKAS